MALSVLLMVNLVQCFKIFNFSYKKSTLTKVQFSKHFVPTVTFQKYILGTVN